MFDVLDHQACTFMFLGRLVNVNGRHLWSSETLPYYIHAKPGREGREKSKERKEKGKKNRPTLVLVQTLVAQPFDGRIFSSSSRK
jgi:hypothetical protein